MGRRRRRRRHRLRKWLTTPLLILGVSVAGAGGYEYYQTGEITATAGFVREAAEQIGRLPQAAGELERQVRSQLLRMQQTDAPHISMQEIPVYTGESFAVVDDNFPEFDEAKKNGAAYEFYSELDALGRCGYAEAKITPKMMPTEERGQIGDVRPSGWHTVKYEGIDGNYLYNRCHLIGYQLTGENANEKNLITGTRYLNVVGMLPWENLVADYLKNIGDAVMYRVTPVYEGENLVASGVRMEAQSLGSDAICFDIFVFNVQPGIEIDYATGESWCG